MGDFLFRLAVDSDGLVVGFAVGLIIGGMAASGLAYEAGRRRTYRELAALERLPELNAEAAAAIVPKWPRDAA